MWSVTIQVLKTLKQSSIYLLLLPPPPSTLNSHPGFDVSQPRLRAHQILTETCTHTDPEPDLCHTVMPDFSFKMATSITSLLSSQPRTARQRNYWDKPTRPTSYPPVYQGTLCRSCHLSLGLRAKVQMSRKYGLGARQNNVQGETH